MAEFTTITGAGWVRSLRAARQRRKLQPNRINIMSETPPYFPQGTEARVCEDIARRQAFGFKKYATTVEHNPLVLRQWLQHAYEEHLDAAIYLRRAIEQLDKEATAKVPRI